MTYYGFSEVGPMTKEAEDACRKPKFSYYLFESRLKHLQGEILTLIDAATADVDQRKSQKDIIRKFFGDELLDCYNEATNSGGYKVPE